MGNQLEQSIRLQTTRQAIDGILSRHEGNNFAQCQKCGSINSDAWELLKTLDGIKHEGLQSEEEFNQEIYESCDDLLEQIIEIGFPENCWDDSYSLSEWLKENEKKYLTKPSIEYGFEAIIKFQNIILKTDNKCGCFKNDFEILNRSNETRNIVRVLKDKASREAIGGGYMTNNKSMWMVRAGESAYLIDDFKSKNIVAIGWNQMGDLSTINSPEKIKELYRKNYPDDKDGRINITSGQISRFRFELNKGDYAITYNPGTRSYLVGEIIKDYEYNEKLSEYYHIHQVKWLGEVSRDKLSTTTKNTLGAISTLFKLNDEARAEMLQVLEGDVKVPENNEQEKAELATIKEDVASKAQEFIKDKIISLDWEEMQELVAGLLRGMGYKTIVSPKGSDRGRDIQASPDGLGLEDPRIIVEVKHRTGQMGSKEVRSFITGVGHGSKGLYVSTGGFSKEAKYEADRSTTPITLIDIDMLVGLLVQYYDNLDTDTRALVPLIKIYWPV